MKPSQETLKVVTWNVNSINVRLERLLHLLKREAPDLVCLQELKCTEDKFPFSALEELGYHATVRGQKTYNGVAILSRTKPTGLLEDWKKFLPESEARIVGIQLETVIVVCVYVPNGQEVGSEKYSFKLNWLTQLHGWLRELSKKHAQIILAGDFNVAPTDLDVYDPEKWRDQILFSNPEKNALFEIYSLGFQDLFRKVHPNKEAFTWWDYRQGGFARNHGLRIDFILGTKNIADRVEASYVDRNERKGEQPSDHAPVISILKNQPS